MPRQRASSSPRSACRRCVADCSRTAMTFRVGALTAVITHAFWSRRFAGDPAIIGTSLTVGGQPYTVIGVAPDAVRAFSPAEMYLSLPVPAASTRPHELVSGARPASHPASSRAQAEVSDRHHRPSSRPGERFTHQHAARCRPAFFAGSLRSAHSAGASSPHGGSRFGPPDRVLERREPGAGACAWRAAVRSRSCRPLARRAGGSLSACLPRT